VQNFRKVPLQTPQSSLGGDSRPKRPKYCNENCERNKKKFPPKKFTKKNQIGFCLTRNCDEVGVLWAILVTFLNNESGKIEDDDDKCLKRVKEPEHPQDKNLNNKS
jgi:hypothetical protein